MFSVLNINKPAGLTSHDVVARVRRILNIQKVGHAGTLDPQATGVLPLFIGQATRLLEYIATDKGYRADITFGVTTTTWDGDGAIEQRCDTVPCITPDAIEALLPRLLGEIEQTIPLYSAKRVGGKKLYERARAGEVVETLPTKKVTIQSITLEGLTTNADGLPVATLQVHCGSGTFMRTLAYDLGQWLGCGAYLSGLVRTHHGQFTLETAVDLDTWMESEDPKSYLQLPNPYLAIETVVCVYPSVIQALFGGTNVLERQLLLEAPQLAERLKQVGIKNQEHCLMVGVDNKPLGVVAWRNHALKPHKMFPVQADTQPQSMRGGQFGNRRSGNASSKRFGPKKRAPHSENRPSESHDGSHGGSHGQTLPNPLPSASPIQPPIHHNGKMPISVGDASINPPSNSPNVYRVPLPSA